MTFTPKSWGNFASGGTPLNAAALVDLETRLAAYTDIASGPGIFRPETYGAVGDGVTDDSAAWAATVTAAAGARIVCQSGKTYLFGSTITIPTTLRIDGNDATIKKSVSLNGYGLIVSGSSVDIRDLTVDGNSSGLSGCIKWTGASGQAWNTNAVNGQFGWVVTGTGVQLDAWNCTANTNSIYGFGCEEGRLRLYNFRADNNVQFGVLIDPDATGCHLDGTANNTNGMGVKILGPGGTIGRLVTSNNRTYGLYAEGSVFCKDWTAEYIEDNDCGQGLGGIYTPNESATSVELFGVSGFKMPKIIARRALGYGVALTKDAALVGCLDNTIGVDIRNVGDPAVHISGGSKRNVITGIVNEATLALSFGEGVTGQNDDNVVDLEVIGVGFAVLNMNTGSRNRIRIRAKDCTANPPYTALARFGLDEGLCEDNVLDWESSNPNTTGPPYVFAFDASIDPAHNSTQRNQIIGTFAKDYTTALYSDPNGTNRVSLLGAPATTPQAANYTLVATDNGTIVEGTKATAQTVTIPPNASVPFPIGTTITIVQMGAGQITLTPGAGVTIRTARTLTTRALYSAVQIYKRGTNEWVASGDLT